MRLIDADALMKTLGITDTDCDKCAWHDSEWSNCKRGGDFEDACCAIENAPTIEERNKGKWIWDDEGYHCSECFFHAHGNTLECLDGTYRYCPNCGADMRGETNE